MKMISLALAASLLSTAALAHGDHDPTQGTQKPPPFAVLQLDQVRDATAQFLDVEKAEAAGYHDIHLFVPHMGWHYMKDALVDGKFDPTKFEDRYENALIELIRSKQQGMPVKAQPVQRQAAV